jgi:uncharacterized protein YkwD
MKFTTFSLALGLSLALGGCLSSPAPKASRPAAVIRSIPFTPQNALSRVNAYRQAQGVPPVRLDPVLMRAAASHSKAMEASGTMSHDTGGEFSARLASFGVGRAAAVENIAAGQKSLDEVMQGWRNSSGHAANLRNPAMTRMGIAASGGYWTLIMTAD